MVYMFLANGFEETEALAPLDLLRRAGVEVTTVGVGCDTVVGSHGIPVVADIPDTHYRDSKPDMIILPGGWPGTKNLDSSSVVHSAVSASARNGGYVCAICAAPMVLGGMGLLRGKNATCYPGFEQYLDGAVLTSSSVCVDGKIITASSMGAAYDFGIELVRAIKGDAAAETVKASSYPTLGR